MLNNLHGVSPVPDAMSECVKAPSHAPVFASKTNGAKNYSDKNGNDVSKVSKRRKTFAFWALVCLLFLLAIGNLILTFVILAVLRLGQGMESMEFLPEHNAIKLFGNTNLEHIYKRDGVIEGFRDTPLSIVSENGSVNFNLQTRLSRSDTKLTVNASGVFACGVSSLSLSDPSTHESVFSTADTTINMQGSVNNLNAKQISTPRISAPTSSDLLLRSDSSIHLRGAEGSKLEAKQISWSADQDVRLRSVNGSVVVSGKEGVYVDVRYLPITLQLNRTTPPSFNQYKLCVCMPQGKLFRIHVSSSDVTCASVNLGIEHNPCE